ncbi:MAG: MOSC N-terminal beta barrel domain-containing protein [Parasphingorhabdus sp.]
MKLSEIWRFPVKSMMGEKLEHANVSQRGILGDRAYALIDVETGRVGSAKDTRKFSGILNCKARFVEDPVEGDPVPPVLITLPDGQSVTSDSADVNTVLSGYFNREVTLEQSAPEEFVIDADIVDVEHADPAGDPGTTKEQKLGASLFRELGMDSAAAEGLFFDVFPLTVLTDATMAELERHAPGTQVDPRRFRMNLILETEKTGFVENDWVGQMLTIGDSLSMAITMPDPRCVVTTLPQDGLPQDVEVIRQLVKNNRLDIGGSQFPCAGVYAMPVSGGKISVGSQCALV